MPYVVIHPGSGSPHKCVDSSLMGEVARRLLEYPGIAVVILGGPADQFQVKRLFDEIPSRKAQLVTCQSLSTVAVVLKKAVLYIGHDSGISHLASGMGTPSIVLFGPTNPDFWAPRGDHVTVIQGPSCQCADWQEIRQCREKICLKFSADRIVKKAEELIHVNGKSQIVNFKSQKNSKNQRVRNPISNFQLAN